MNAIRVETVVEADGVLHFTNLPCRRGDHVEAVIVLHRETRERERDAARRRFLERRAAVAVPFLGPLSRATNFMNAIDTNVWIYCHDTRDREKQETAQKLVSAAAPIVLLWQVGCEFIAAARKLEFLGFKPEDAWEALGDMQTMAEKVVMPSAELWPRCRETPAEPQPSFLGRPHHRLLPRCRRFGRVFRGYRRREYCWAADRQSVCKALAGRAVIYRARQFREFGAKRIAPKPGRGGIFVPAHLAVSS